MKNKTSSDNVRVTPVFREHVDVEKFCQALIEIAKSMAEKQKKESEEK